MKIGDKIKLNATLCSNGIITKLNEELGICTILWLSQKISDNEGVYQLEYIEHVEKFNQL